MSEFDPALILYLEYLKGKVVGGFPACALRALRDPAEVKRRREIRTVTYVHSLRSFHKSRAH